MTHRRRAPRPLALPLERVRVRWEPASELGRAQSAWEDVGRVWREVLGAHGSYVIERATAVSLKAGVLTVSCTEAVVAQTLELEAERIISGLNERLGGQPVRRLRCVTGGR